MLTATSDTAPTTRASRRVSARFRPDVEGLRALAILLVVADHAWHWPAGGFVGVDVFLVISGYLITRGLVRERIEKGRVMLSAFYVKRMARLLPASALVIVATAVLCFAVYFPITAAPYLPQAFASLFWVQNWALIRQGTDYLNPTGAQSPFQHFWSLSLEEQFYAVWPWLLLAVIFLVARSSSARTVRRTAAWLVVVVSVGSLAISVMVTETQPAAAYFFPFTRLWEFGVGALVACTAFGLRGRSVSAVAVRWIGLGLIVGSALLYSPATPFPGVAALVPVVGAAMVIFAAERADEPAGFGRVLPSAPARYLGRISYSLYLWHFPVLILLAAVMHGSWLAPLIGIPICIVLATLTYRYVEDPMRKLEFWTRLRTRLGSWPTWTRIIGFALTTVLIAGLSVYQWRGPIPTLPEATASVSQSEVASTEQLQQRLGDAIEHPTWSGYGAQLSSTALVGAPQLACLRDSAVSHPAGATALADCTNGQEGGQHAIVMGDSIAMSWAPAVEEALGSDWQVSALGLQSCPAALVSVGEQRGRTEFADSCMKARQADIDAVVAAKPDLVVIASAEGSFVRLSDGATGARAVQEWQAGLEQTLERLQLLDAPIVVVGNPPETVSPVDCAVRTGSPADCLSQPSDAFAGKAKAEEAAVAAMAARGENVTYIDPFAWFCVPELGCPVGDGETVARIDHGHLTAEYSRMLGSLLDAELAGKVETK